MVVIYHLLLIATLISLSFAFASNTNFTVIKECILSDFSHLILIQFALWFSSSPVSRVLSAMTVALKIIAHSQYGVVHQPVIGKVRAFYAAFLMPSKPQMVGIWYGEWKHSWDGFNAGQFPGQQLALKLLSYVQLFATPWTIACQAPLSLGILWARILKWVAIPSSRGSSQPRNQTQVSHIAGEFFTSWAIRKALRLF